LHNCQPYNVKREQYKPEKCYTRRMLVIGFIQWWYTAGWSDAVRRVWHQARQVYRNFSIPTLLRTLFQPWRRITSSSDGPLTERLRAVLDNLVSRFVGFSVRIMALLAAAILLVLVLLFGGVFIAAWPFLPPLGLVLVIAGLIGGGR
jgi:hypothetical protein